MQTPNPASEARQRYRFDKAPCQARATALRSFDGIAYSSSQRVRTNYPIGPGPGMQRIGFAQLALKMLETRRSNGTSIAIEILGTACAFPRQ